MAEIDHTIWKSESVVAYYLERKDSRPFIQEQIGVMMRLVKDLGRPVRRFMDLGCGDGILAAIILDNYQDATAILADHSAPMLEAASAKLQGLSRSTHFCNVDYSRPDWTKAVAEHSPFDLVVSGFSIHHQPDERKIPIYSEIFDMLASGGMFINLEHVASPTKPIAELWDRIRIDSLRDLAVKRGLNKSRATIEKEYFERPDREANLFSLVETQCEWLRKIGYVDVDCFFKYFELAIFGGRRP
ncbi:MAG: class I SAM-dependent methyltransferase [Deltaproteobacteria bacterium]|nr:class I SAM-dependent methyltransferase [Deltaproteobacteria bacterium]